MTKNSDLIGENSTPRAANQMVSSAMTYSAFIRHLRTTLHYLYDPSQLRRSPIAVLFGAENTFDRPRALQQIIIEAINALQPKNSAPSQSRAWRIYHALNYRYVQQLDRDCVAAQMGISGRQLRREQLAAIEDLAEYLWRKYDLERIPSPELAVTTADHTLPEIEPVIARQRQAPSQVVMETQVEVREIIQIIEQLSHSIDIRIEGELAQHLPRLTVPPAAFRQMLLNLFALAIPYTQPGPISISAVLEDNKVELTMVRHHVSVSPLIYAEG